MKTGQILLNIDKETKEQFQKNCKALGVSMTTVILSAILDFNNKATNTKTK